MLWQEKMRLPIGKVRRQIPEQQWEAIETSSRQILDMTEQTLSMAKEEEWKRQARKQHSFKVFFIVSLLASCLLMVAWFAYLYRTAARETAYQVNDCFEAAFYDEVVERYPLFLLQTKGGKKPVEQKLPEEAPFARNNRNFYKERRLSIA